MSEQNTPDTRPEPRALRIVRGVISHGVLLGIVALAVYGGWWLMFSPEGTGSGGGSDEVVMPPAVSQGEDSVHLAGMLPSFRADLDALGAHPHRLAGSANAHDAGEHIRRRLGQMGLEVIEQRFPLVMVEHQGVTIQVDDGQPQTLYAARPNLIVASVTPPEGITGQTLYAGAGRLSDYGKHNPEGRIVLLDYAQGAAYWRGAFAMGAKAVVFVGDDEPAALAWHHLNIPAVLPRFYLPRADAQRLGLLDGPRKATLRSRATWQGRDGRNIIAVVRGSSPQFSLGQPEAIVLAAAIDSYGEVPDLAAGGRAAANAAALLGVAEYFAKYPPRRDVIFCFFDGQAQANAGARAFYGALIRATKNEKLGEPLTVQRDQLEREEKHIRAVLELLEDPKYATISSDLKERAAIELMEVAKIKANDQREIAQDLRRWINSAQAERDDLHDRLEDAGGSDRASLHARLGALEDELAQQRRRLEQAQAASEGWSNLQRDLNDHAYSAAPEFEQTKLELQRLRGTRLREIERAKGHNTDAMALEKAVGGSFIVLHLSLDFGEPRDRWTVVHGDQAVGGVNPLGGDTTGIYQQDIFKAFEASRVLVEQHQSGALQGFDRRPILERSNEAELFMPARRADSGAVARLFGIWNLAAVTTFDHRPREGQPQDTLAAMGERVENIRRQGSELALLVWALGRSDGLSVPRRVAPMAGYVEHKWEDGKVSGATATVLAGGSAVADRPARHGVVAIMPACNAGNWAPANLGQSVPGFEQNLVVAVDGNGCFDFGPVHKAATQFGTSANYVCAIFDYDDPAQPKPDGVGLPAFITNAATVGRPIATIGIQLFPAKSITVCGQGFERGSIATMALRAESTALFRTDFSLTAEVDQTVVVYMRPTESALKLFNPMGLAILNNTVAAEAGRGVPFNSPFEFFDTSRRSAADLLTLNQARLQLLIDNHIIEGALKRLLSQAEETYREAVKAAAAGEPDSQPSLAKTRGDFMASNALNRRVYFPLLSVLNDLVVAVVFLLLLAIPFAYALERLLVGTPHIYRQIGYVTIFFLLTFAVLYVVNPAFKIAATPIIIFLAFAIIVLSALVIFIMVRKLREEIKRMQGLATTVHSSDVSRLSTLMAAVNMGISTMRRRPLRTILTAVTVVLLTFTILTFASFSNTWGIRPRYVGPQHQPQRVLVRQALWGPIDETVVEMFRGTMEGRGIVVPRLWVAPTATEVQNAAGATVGAIAVTRPDGAGNLDSLSALVGIDPEDLARQDALAAIFREYESAPEDGGPAAGPLTLPDDGIYLTEAVAQSLQVQLGDELIVRGRPLRLAGLVSPRALTEFTEMEGSSLLPVDYQSSQGGGKTSFTEAQAASANEAADVESAQFVNFSPDKVGFVSPRTARMLGGRIRSFQMYAAQPDATEEQVNALATEVAKLVPMPAYYSSPQGVYRLYFTTLTAASGFRDLVIPVVLGGLIVFATMLGSVSDREREIYTFSALGLAPAHVASLFFAEASVYAVVGGMGGYLLGQTVGRVLGWLSSMHVLEMPPMNYSSSNAIVTILIVMGTTLISTIYPALKASRSANPGVQRMWRIPAPQGDVYDIIFPFTVSSYDITGVVSFLKEHFDNYGDTSLGNFATDQSLVFRQKGQDLPGFEAGVALAPFDLGVTQDFTLLSRPSEIAGIDEVRILLRRRSGSPNDWKRANRTFVSDLRRQLLIWRALPAEVVEKYRQQTLDQWQNLPVGSELAGAEVGQ